MKYISGFVLFTLISVSLGQVVRNGTCRALPVISNFVLDAYLGVWYQIERYDDTIQAGTDCNTAEYSRSEDPDLLVVVNSATYLTTGNHISITGRGVVSFPHQSPLLGMLNVTFDEDLTKQNYQIVSTDYVNWSVIWNCRNRNDGNSEEHAYVLSRSYLIKEEHQVIIDKIKSDYLEATQLRPTYQGQLICLGGGIEPL